MNQFRKTGCSGAGRMSKSTLLKLIGVPQNPSIGGAFNEAFDASFEQKKAGCNSRFSEAFDDSYRKSTFGTNMNPTQKMFYNLCESDWEIISFDSVARTVCVQILTRNNIISINLPQKTSFYITNL